MKGYKVFNPDWSCRGFKYEVGKTYEHKGDIGLCKAGFHFCQRITDCFNYYEFNSNNKVAEIEAVGSVETEGNKSVTDKISILRELSWNEVLELANTGKSCTGLGNTGNRNTGNCNTGNWNTGNLNTGNCNTGNCNTGDWNTGNCNTGNCNTGNCNTGNRNTGDWNTGNCNTGNRNTGNCNTGNWNSCNYSTGFFNSDQMPIYAFNKPLETNRDDFTDSKGYRVLMWNFENAWWIYAENMTEKEKSEHPDYEATGGYLKTVDFKTACKMMWEKLEDDEKQAVRDIPNFNSNVFKEITGIDMEEGKE